MSTKQKQLSLSTINKQHSAEFSQKKRVTLKNGDYLDLQVKFKKTSIQRLLLDFQEITEQLKDKNVSWKVFRDSTFVFYMLLLRNFTSLGDSIPLDIEKMIILCEKLIDLDLLEEIMGHFEKEELDKIYALIKEVGENSNFIGNTLGEAFVSATINENKEIKDA